MAQQLINPASTSRVRVCQVEEVSRGTIPDNPAWKTLPILDDTALDSVKTFERSAEVDASRMGGQQVGGNRSAGGTLVTTAKMDSSVRDLYASAFSGVFVNPQLQGTSLAYVSNGTYASIALALSGNFADGATLTLNGVVFTFRTAPTLANDVAIGANSGASFDNLIAALALSTEPSLSVARYRRSGGSTFQIFYKTAGTAGNAYTVSWSLSANTFTPTAPVGGSAGAAAQAASTSLAGGTGSPDRITDSQSRFLTAGFRVGHYVVTAGSTTSGNNITYRIASVAADGSSIELDRDIATAEAFPSGGTITSDAMYLVAGTTRHTFAHEVSYLDLLPVLYEYFLGNEVNDLTIDIPTSGEVKSTFTMVGVDFSETQVPFPLGSGARTPVEDYKPFAGSVNGAALYREGNSLVDTETMSVKVMNNRDAKYGVGRETAAFVEQGDFDVEITSSIYFTSPLIRTRYNQGTRMALAVVLRDPDGNHMRIEVPRAVVTAAPKGKSGKTVTEQVTFSAEKDPVSGTKALLWFTPAT